MGNPEIVDLYSTLQVEMDYPAALLIPISHTIKSREWATHPLVHSRIQKTVHLPDRNRKNKKGGREKSLKIANKFRSAEGWKTTMLNLYSAKYLFMLRNMLVFPDIRRRPRQQKEK